MALPNPPYMNSYGRIGHIVGKIKEARTPDRFTYEFLKEVILARGGNDRAFVGLAKRCGLLNSDGSPTDRYKRLRSTDEAVSKGAMAAAIKQGYQDLYDHNEYVHLLSEKDLEGLVLQLTGAERGNKTARNVVKTFGALKKHADFDADRQQTMVSKSDKEDSDSESKTKNSQEALQSRVEPALGLSYQINLVLPRTDDVAVFNAIFKSLKEHLLSK